ncbi:MAG: hypothetical protein ACE5IZ_07920 [Dehalococcoidia bacterium]
MAAEIARRKRTGGERHPLVRGSRLAEGETFSALLRRFMEGHGLSISSLARHSWLDIAYVWRLVRDENDLLNPQPGGPRARHPSRDAVIRLGLALRLGIEEMDELLLAAGYAPLVR